MQRDPRRRQRSAVELIAQIDVAARAPAPSARPRAAPPERAADTAEGSGAEEADLGPTVVSTPGTRRRQASSTPSAAASSAPSVAAPPAGSTAAPVTAPVTAVSGLSGSALGAALNDRGYALIQAGDYGAAVPILRRAVAAFPRDSTELVYGYALYNLAHALRLSGHPAAAIPLLRRRLRIPDQIPTVRAELAAARAAAGGP
jgi:tetratricopeptide (TPR) repeat protein